MTTLWMTSYIALWIIVAALGLITLGLAREVALLHQLAKRTSRPSFPPPHEDGPRLSSELPDLPLDTCNGFGQIRLRERDTGRLTVLVFLSPTCEGCQLIAEPLNAVIEREAGRLRVVAIMRGQEVTTRAFVNLFPLHAPVVFDVDEAVTTKFGVHYAPFALLYGDEGFLVRKGSIGDSNDLAALLGDTSVPEEALANVYPRPDARGPTYTRDLAAPLVN